MRSVEGEKQIDRVLNDEMAIEIVHIRWIFAGEIHGESFFIGEIDFIMSDVV